MKTIPSLFALFFLIPIAEIYLLINISGIIGALPTIGLVVFTALLGAWMLRQQGFATLMRVRTALENGRPPAQELLEGAILLVGGALLLTPGFFTDALGFFCLLPQTRRWLLTRIFKRFITIDLSTTRPTAAAGSRVLEGEWQREDD